MSDASIAPMNERLRQLPLTGADTAMGKLMRKFWQPVALSSALEALSDGQVD